MISSLGLWLKIESKGTLKGARNACEDAYIMDKVECVDSLVYLRMRKKEENFKDEPPYSK